MQKLVGFSMLDGFMNVRPNWRTPVHVERRTQARRLVNPTQPKNQLHFGTTKRGLTAESQQSPDPLETHRKNLNRLQAFANASRQLIPNFSNRRYAALVVLDDKEKTEGMGVNLESNRSLTTCDLTVALNNASMALVKQQQSLLPIPSTKTNPFKAVSQDKPTFSVKQIYLLNVDPQGPAPIPCGNCQELLRYAPFNAETELIQRMPTAQDSGEGDHSAPIERKNLRDLLPLYYAKQTNMPTVQLTEDIHLESLPITFSLKAQAIPKGDQLDEAQVRQLTHLAQKAFTQERPLEANLQCAHAGVSVQLRLADTNIIQSSGNMGWSTRMQDAADLRAVAKAYQAWLHTKRKRNPFAAEESKPNIQALAYFTTNPNYLPSPASLDRILRKGGSPHTQIITVTADRILVCTVEEYMPFMYRN